MMRDDMYKKLVERARPGGHGARKGRPTRDLEDAPARQGFRKAAIATGDPKSLSENLAPLRRYLAGQVNRPWSKVQSEMRATVDVRNPVQAHLFAHLDGILHTVVTKVPPSAGAPCGLTYQDPSHDRGPVPVRVDDLYVDPDDGIIKRARRRTRPQRQAAATEPKIVRLDETRRAVRIEGVWFEVHLAPYTVSGLAGEPGAPGSTFCVGDQVHADWKDPLFGRVRAWDTEKLQAAARIWGNNRLAHRKRPLSESELAALGLNNSHVDA